jgi:hypothetical protein
MEITKPGIYCFFLVVAGQRVFGTRFYLRELCCGNVNHVDVEFTLLKSR